jgi:hypothetical protein
MRYMYSPEINKIKGLSRHIYFDEAMNDYYKVRESNQKWNQMAMDKDNWVESKE